MVDKRNYECDSAIKSKVHKRSLQLYELELGADETYLRKREVEVEVYRTREEGKDHDRGIKKKCDHTGVG